MQERLKTTSFWIGLSGVLVVIVDSISEIFNLHIVSEVVECVVLFIASVLVLLGIVTKKNISDKEDVDESDLLNELKAEDLVDEDKKVK